MAAEELPALLMSVPELRVGKSDHADSQSPAVRDARDAQPSRSNALCNLREAEES